jgi:hypothetical protein
MLGDGKGTKTFIGSNRDMISPAALLGCAMKTKLTVVKPPVFAFARRLRNRHVQDFPDILV